MRMPFGGVDADSSKRTERIDWLGEDHYFAAITTEEWRTNQTLCVIGIMRPSLFTNDTPRSINEILGERTRWVLDRPERVESFILKRPRSSVRRGIDAYTILARGPGLTAEQIASLQQMIFEPLSHYDGRPIFKRLPSVPDFAFRFNRDESTLDLLVDLHNPGWEFHCETERHWDWNWVGGEMVALAKVLFPEHASDHTSSVWKRGAMKRLAAVAVGRAT